MYRWKNKVYELIQSNELLIFLLVAVTVLRIPNLLEPYWYGDEGIYLTVGQGLSRGLKLYAEIVDHKTPVIYWLAQMAQTLLTFKLMLLISSLVSVTLFWLLAERLLKERWAVIVASISFALMTTLPRFEGNIVNAELLLMPFVLAGMWLFWRLVRPVRAWEREDRMRYTQTTWWKLVLIGACFSMALLTKVPAVFDFGGLVVFGGMFLPQIWGKKTWKLTLTYMGWIAGGFLLPVVLTMVYFGALGTLSDYYNFGLLYNFKYVSLWELSNASPVTLFFMSMKGRVLLLGLYFAGVYGLRKRVPVSMQFALVWLGVTTFAMLLSLRPYPHYFMQIVPPLCLLIGGFVFSGAVSRWVIVGVSVTLWWVLLLLEFHPYPTRAYYKNFAAYLSGLEDASAYFDSFDAKTRDTYRAAYFLKTHTTPDERVFIWGNEPMIYSLADRSPVGKFIVDFHIESVNAYDETMEVLMGYKPKYILDSVHEVNSFPELYNFLGEEYTEYQTYGRVTVYRQGLVQD